MAIRGLLAFLVASLGLSWPILQDNVSDGVKHQAALSLNEAQAESTGFAAREVSRDSLVNTQDQASTEKNSDAVTGAIVGHTNPTSLHAPFSLPNSDNLLLNQEVKALLPEEVNSTSESLISQVVEVPQAEVVTAQSDSSDLGFEQTVSEIARDFASDSKVMVAQKSEANLSASSDVTISPIEDVAGTIHTQSLTAVDESNDCLVQDHVLARTFEEQGAASGELLIRDTGEQLTSTAPEMLPTPLYNQTNSQEYVVPSGAEPLATPASLTILTSEPPLPPTGAPELSTIGTVTLTELTEPTPAPEALVIPETTWAYQTSTETSPHELVESAAIAVEPNSTEGLSTELSQPQNPIDSAVRLTRKAFRAWVTALSNHPEVASKNFPVTR